jgi:hypothetical protein
MAEENSNWKVPTLTRENHDKWFRIIGAKLEGKGVIYVTQQTLLEYARVAVPSTKDAENNQDLEELTGYLGRLSISPDSTIASTPAEGSRVFLNIDKKAKYQKDAGTVKFYLLQGLNDDDQALLDEYDTPKALWEYLKSKYTQPSKLAAAKYTKELHDFTWNNNFTIIDAWNKLKEIRRKIIAAKPLARTQYDDDSLMLILTTVLPDQYQSTVDTLNIQADLSIDDQIKHLQNKEERLGLGTDERESGHAAYSSREPRGLRTKRSREFYDNHAESEPACYYCDDNHLARKCPFKADIRKFVQQLKRRQTNQALDYSPNHSPNRRPRTSERRPLQQPSQLRYRQESRPRKHKSHGLAGVASDSEDSLLDDLSWGDSDSELEVAALTKEQKTEASRKHPQSWPVDTGASSHMTDKLNLFRGPLRTLEQRKAIQVGGGMLSSWQCGTAKVVAEDGSSCLLRNTLFVPGLGVNLISARRLCKDGIEGHFDAKNMYFKKDNRRLIHAQQQDGLYLVKSISKDCPETAFPAFQEPSDSEEAQPSDVDPDESEDDDLSKNQRRTYRLMHRRFGHYGSKSLRYLHEVSNIKKIKIPPIYRRICEACKIGKMRKKINKTLAKHKAEPLALVSIDIAGPFVMSIRGYVYFLQIIDNYTRKVWTIPLKTKGEAISQLQA